MRVGARAERETIVASASWKDANRRWSNDDDKDRDHGTAETKSTYSARTWRDCPKCGKSICRNSYREDNNGR